MFCVETVVNGKILLHVCKENRDIEDVLPRRADVLQNEPHVFEHRTALRFDVVTNDMARCIERHAGNFFAAAHARTNAGEKQEITDTFRVRKRADWFRRARTFKGFSHYCGAYFSNFGRSGSIWSHGCASEVQISNCGLNDLGSSRLEAVM